jgi:hypothetical protein
LDTEMSTLRPGSAAPAGVSVMMAARRAQGGNQRWRTGEG